MRHAPTEWNERGLVMGQVDIPLSARGLRQAEEALGLLKGLEIDMVYSSPMSRCVQTANILASGLKLPMVTVDGLEERNWGVYEGRYRAERDQTENPPGGETCEQFRFRVAHAYDLIAALDQTSLIVTHSGVIREALKMAGAGGAHPRIPHALPIEVCL